MQTQVREEIALRFSPQEAEHIANLATVIRNGGLRDPEQRRAINLDGGLSHGGQRSRVFMHPAAALALGDAGKQYVGNKALRQWGQLRQFAQPDLSDVHVDAVITNISVAYRNTAYIGPEIFPRVQVLKESGKYFTFDKGPWLRDEAKMRAVGAGFARGGYTLSPDSYSVDEYGFEHAVDDRVRNNADNPLNPDRTGAEFVSDKVDLGLERRIASLVFTGANWTNTTAPTAWDNNAGTPFTDFKTARLAVLKETGRAANTVVFGVEAFEVLALHSGLLERIKYTGTNERPAMVTAQMMAALFGVDRVLVGSGIYDTSNEPAASAETFIWGKNVWVGYVAPTPAIETPSAGYLFTTGRLGDRYREPQTKSDIIRVCEATDEKVTSADAGYLMTSVVA